MRVHGGGAINCRLLALALLVALAAMVARPVVLSAQPTDGGSVTLPTDAAPGLLTEDDPAASAEAPAAAPASQPQAGLGDGVAPAPSAGGVAGQSGPGGLPDWHIIKHFDFDEAKLGNEGDVPMYWYRFTGADYADFPRYAVGYWDRTFGYTGKHSFRLELNGGNVGYYYQTNTIAILPGQDVRIEAKVRTTQLVQARALLEVSFNDARGEAIPASRRRSPLIGGPGRNDRWTSVAVMIPGKFPAARYINLSIFVLQPSRWRPLDPALRDQPNLVDFIDVHGKAWFDDITIYRLPRVTMTTGQPGQLAPPATQPAIRIDVEGFANQPLEAVLTVHDLAERLVGYQVFDSPGSDKPIRSLEWRGQALAAGLYHSNLALYAGGARLAGMAPLLSRQLIFAQLGPSAHQGNSANSNSVRGSTGGVAVGRAAGVGVLAGGGAGSRGFGLVMSSPPAGMDEPSARVLADDQAGAIAALPVSLVKLPMWRSEMRPDSLEQADPWTDQIIHRLAGQRVGLVGVFGSIPGPLQAAAQASGSAGNRGNLRRSLLDILAGDVAGWRPYVAPQLARHADQIRYWQIGQEDDPGFAQDPRFGPTIAAVRREFHTLLSSPTFVATWPAMFAYRRTGLPGENPSEKASPSAKFPAEIGNLFLASRMPAEFVLDYVTDFADLTATRPWATVEAAPMAPAAAATQEDKPGQPAQPGQPGQREARLADLAWRLTMAYAGLAEPVPPAVVKGPKTAGNLFLAAPWTVRDVAGVQLVEPTEELLIFRTVADLLGGCRYGGRIMLAEGVIGHIFDRGDGTGALAVQNTTSQLAVPIEMHFGQSVALVDLWGNREPLDSGAGQEEEPSADGKVSTQRVTAGRLPFFLDGIDPRIARLRASFRLNPPFVPSSYRKHVRQVAFINPFDAPISGRVTLHFPANWDVQPRIIAFSAQAGETFTRDVEIRFPYNAEAGAKQLSADFQIDADRSYRVQMTTGFEFGLGDVDVTTMTQWLPDDELLVTLNVTNRSDGRLDMYCFVVAADLPRQERVIAGLPAGATVVKSFRIPAAKPLIGQSVRVGLREIKGNRLVNYDVPIR